MTKRVSANISTSLNTSGTSWKSSAQNTQEAKPVGKQVEEALFGKRKPQELLAEDFPEISELLRKLDAYRRKLAKLAGDPEEEYRLTLAQGALAMIDAQGTIYLGIHFLAQFGKNMEVMVGALAHEIGHRPKRWREYKDHQSLSVREVESLCRYEETRADLFAGRGLAALELSCEPLIQFLADLETGPHPKYFPAQMRADIIREGWRLQHSSSATRAKFSAIWPELEREMSIKRHIGEL